MKVLFVTHWFPKTSKPNQGIFILEHAKAIRKQGVDLTILSIQFKKGFFPKLDIAKSTYQGVPLETLTISFPSYKLAYVAPWLLLRIYKSKLKEIARLYTSVDIINSNVLLPAGYFGYFLSQQINVPHVITEHWSKAHLHLEGKLYKFSTKFSRRILSKSNALTAVSNFTLQNLINTGVTLPLKLSITPNVVPNVQEYSNHTSKENIKLLAVANWKLAKSDPKLPYLIIDVVAKFSKSNPEKNIQLTLAGGGDAIKTLEEYAQTVNVDLVSVGFLKKEKLYKLFQESDLLLHASKTETFSLVIAEALKNGLPVLASNVGAIPDLVRKSDGVLCKNNVDVFAEALTLLINKPLDRLAIFENNKDRFTEEIVAKSFIEVYSLLLN